MASGDALVIDEDEVNDEWEEVEEEEEERAIGRRGRRTGRGVTLSMLLSDGILKPGEGTMSIDYLGKNFVGDLLASGKIRWQETRQLFNSPSAWAIYCKKQVNPEKKSGCGWASVKYLGRKLDYYKTLWFRKHRDVTSKLDEQLNGIAVNGMIDYALTGDKLADAKKLLALRNAARGGDDNRRVPIPHASLGVRNSDYDPNILIECTAFSALGKIQPFTVTMSSSCLMLMDFHSHLTTSEVVGYLAGSWDINSHNLAVLQAFPCRCRLGDKENSPVVEDQVRQSIERQGLTLLGWYHSHPSCSPQPTLRDINTQIDYQIRLKGNSDASYTPCLGMICSPYDKDSPHQESAILAYWVMPPPENRPLEYGKPMLMNYAVTQDGFLHNEVLAEMRLLWDYYKSAPDVINFDKEWTDGITYLDKLQATLGMKRSSDATDTRLAEVLKGLSNSAAQ